MSYSVKTIPKFEKHLKKLSKKYPSLKAEYIKLIQVLKENPEHGTPCVKIFITFFIQFQFRQYLYWYRHIGRNFKPFIYGHSVQFLPFFLSTHRRLSPYTVSYTHLRAHETDSYLV